MRWLPSTGWQPLCQINQFTDPTGRSSIVMYQDWLVYQYQDWLEQQITEFRLRYQNNGDTHYTIASLILQASKDKDGTRALQNMISARPPNDNSEFVVDVLANNVETLILHPNALFAFKQCLMLAWQVNDIPCLGEQFIAKSLSLVMAKWEELVRGRSSGSTYKVLMWMTEFMYIKDKNDNLLTICLKTLEEQQQLRRSSTGHLILQHALTFTQKAMMKATTVTRKASWKYIRTGFINAASEAIRHHTEWSGYTNYAGHFINKCLEMIASDPTDEDLVSHRAVLIKFLADDQPLLCLICRHRSGQYTAKRLYELGDVNEKNDLAKKAYRGKCAIEKPDMRPPEKFLSSMFMPDHAYLLEWPDAFEITGYETFH
jgi:hypothetical protein